MPLAKCHSKLNKHRNKQQFPLRPIRYIGPMIMYRCARVYPIHKENWDLIILDVGQAYLSMTKNVKTAISTGCTALCTLISKFQV